jgi:hypothetical protein
MPTLVPHHQFEIRYTTILNFPNVIRTTLAPFVKLAKRINIENEGIHNERITLAFDDEYYQIIVTWDRLIIRYEGDKENLSKNNSIIEEPFFNILGKIRELDNFGEINNLLYYSFIIHPMEISKKELLQNFTTKYLNNTNKIIDHTSDVAVILEKNSDSEQISLNFGPYFGEEDLKKRNIIVKHPLITEIAKNLGLCCEYKFFNHLKTVSFADYKEITKTENSLIQKIWEL